MTRIAINGYGRIGRSFLRAYYESKSLSEGIELVAVNEPADCKTIAHLTRYDSTHGRFTGKVEVDGDELFIDGDRIQILHETRLDRLDWRQLDIDVVLECSGVISTREEGEGHLAAGAKRLLFSQPADASVDATIVYGINHGRLTGREKIISTASCSTNCVVPVIKVLHDHFGVDSGLITTIHSAMNDQPVIDAYHNTDLRKTRAAMQSIIPVDTGLARGIDRLLPELQGRFQAQALRVPTINVSAIDLSVYLQTEVTVERINEVLQTAALQDLRGILGYTEEPLASCDFNHDPRSGIVDAGQTRVSRNRLTKVVIWFDNEWGYANRMLDVLKYWLTCINRGSNA